MTDQPAAPGWARPSTVLRPADVHDVQPVRAEPLQHAPLVHLPAPDQILEPDIELAGRLQILPRPQQIQAPATGGSCGRCCAGWR
jgi:hypothetical protein